VTSVDEMLLAVTALSRANCHRAFRACGESVEGIVRTNTTSVMIYGKATYDQTLVTGVFLFRLGGHAAGFLFPEGADARGLINAAGVDEVVLVCRRQARSPKSTFQSLC
jgi:hypothetical protein